MKRLLLVCCIAFLLPTFVQAQKSSPAKVKTLVIDPGHGGNKPGAIGKQIQEKDLVLSIAKKFGKLVNDNYPDVKVLYTRTTDVDIALSERAHIANSNKADLFISIHANSHPTSAPTGVETFVMGLSKSKANMNVARKENADILLEHDYKSNSAYQGFDPNAPESSIIFSMFQNAYIDKSLNFAGFIQSQYRSSLKTCDRGVKQAEFMVLYMSAMPAVLTEVGFISNPAEEAFMVSDAGQAQIALSLFNAFATYKHKEDGTPIPAHPLIDLPGYGKNAKPAPKPAPAPAPVVEEKLPVAPDTAIAAAVDTLLAPPAPAQEVVAEPKAVEKPTFKVQFLTADKPLPADSPKLHGLTDYELYTPRSGSVCYLKGNESTIKEAKAIQDQLRKEGFKDAFVVAFYKGEKIGIQQARELLSNE